MKWLVSAGLCLAAWTTPAIYGSVVIYNNDFESAAGCEWSSSGLATTPSGRHFLGPDSAYGFSNGGVTLMLDFPDEVANVRASFDVYVIGSWNGNTITQGPDLFYFSVQTPEGLNSILTTFSNMDGQKQSYPGPFGLGSYDRWTGAAEHGTLGYSNELDAVYHIETVFPHDGGLLTLAFGAVGLEPSNDETWGLDNVKVSVDHLPEPCTLLLLALASSHAMRHRKGMLRIR